MKKKIMFASIVTILLIVGFLLFSLKYETGSIITLDINPSVEIHVKKDQTVEKVIALNEDAKEMNLPDLKGEFLDEALKTVVESLIFNGYTKDNQIQLILSSKGDLKSEEVVEKLKQQFSEKEISVDFIVMDDITKEDEELAEKYHITPAKASYIRQITKEHDSISVETLINKPVSELQDTKETGKYCEEGYMLEGDWCLKEISRTPANPGEICPSGYIEYEGTCYEEIRSVESDTYICDENFQLVNGKCILEDSHDATAKCESGFYDGKYCVTKEYYGDAVEYCRITPGEDLLYNGRCLGRKPTINGGCLGSDELIGGYCYDTSPSSGYQADWVCPDGSFITNPDGSLIYEDKKCYHEVKVEPTSYDCEGNGTLNGTKCETKEVRDARKENICPSGSMPLDDGSRCLNFHKKANKENGYLCGGENARLYGDQCVLYEVIEAK